MHKEASNFVKKALKGKLLTKEADANKITRAKTLEYMAVSKERTLKEIPLMKEE